ncbi:cell wall-binding repeat-containing protein [Neobacillus niacini]|uniref:cell wall-binding repeat-containing protein n=1 Tax=Neobacillus niacini TaxID=86668 RepID=UPI0020400311|nr:cell wall-binding repeat-containing protein [Neobacillus niacini]MCM3691774.1 cell wall-binding repeat-containing protein [Neobacillus niacini]
MFNMIKVFSSFAIFCFIILIFHDRVASAEQIRISGGDRYETAANISKAGWETAETVVLAQGLDFPDALASVPMAKKYNAPILLTRTEALPSVTIEEIKRLRVRNVIILGGPLAVSMNIEEYLMNTLNLTVKRIGGKTRYKTAEAIAAEMGQYNQVFIVDANNFPDALAIAPYAAITGSPILLTKSDFLPVEIKQAAQKAEKRYVIGGEVAVNDAILSELNAERIAGENRYDTSAKILHTFYQIQPHLYFATGAEFADALAGSALAAKNESGVALVRPNAIPAELQDSFKNYQFSKTFVLGGTQAIQQETAVELDKQVIYEITDRSKPIIFYIPHSDDELLAAGAGIDNFLNRGFDVKVVLLTKGKASAVYNQLLSQFPDMTLEEFGEARVTEFKDSLSRLEVKENNIFVYDFPDSELTEEDVTSVILDFENRFPNAEHRAFSFEDINNDHRAIGIALNDLYWSGKVKNARFYISPYFDNRFIKGFYIKPINRSKVIDAIFAYKLFNPEEGRYSIGYRSVPYMFNQLEENPISKVHLPDKNYISSES